MVSGSTDRGADGANSVPSGRASPSTSPCPVSRRTGLSPTSTWPEHSPSWSSARAAPTSGGSGRPGSPCSVRQGPVRSSSVYSAGGPASRSSGCSILTWPQGLRHRQTGSAFTPPAGWCGPACRLGSTQALAPAPAVGAAPGDAASQGCACRKCLECSPEAGCEKESCRGMSIQSPSRAGNYAPSDRRGDDQTERRVLARRGTPLPTPASRGRWSPSRPGDGPMTACPDPSRRPRPNLTGQFEARPLGGIDI